MITRPDMRRLLAWMTTFFIAMAFLESAVVVYLRALFYPQGFEFPIVPMHGILVTTEVFREFATLVMLLAPGALVTRSALERFAWFCFGFGVWDIFYYVWLKVLLDWPSSLMTFDLLFLIPVPWVGPVWAPCVISIGLILLALVILRGRSKGVVHLVDTRAWVLLITGALIMIGSFVLDPWMNAFDLVELQASGSVATDLGTTSGYVPTTYPWPIFLVGAIVAIAGLTRVHRKGCLVR